MSFDTVSFVIFVGIVILLMYCGSLQGAEIANLKKDVITLKLEILRLKTRAGDDDVSGVRK
ncbi:MAG: hypothetical protein Q4C70_01425 [Planctomycetia bacterium]|nr:hypothetical protein [Planctomycetia bacterium]